MFFTALSKFLQMLINIVGTVLGFLLSLLPSTPFNFISNSQFSSLLSKINYFIPIYEFVVILETWIVSVGIYYLYSVWARWIKAIE